MPAKIPCYIFRLELEFVVDNDLRNEPKNQVLCCTNQSFQLISRATACFNYDYNKKTDQAIKRPKIEP